MYATPWIDLRICRRPGLERLHPVAAVLEPRYDLMIPVALRVERLTKRYRLESGGTLEAVSSISFEVHAGECFGLLGPNGAGKSTTIEIMEGITQPTSGGVYYKGEPMGPRFRSEVG